MSKKIVIALGGNAILRKGERPTVETQIQNTRKALKKIFPIVNKNKVVITHGNGPAVGYLMLQNEMARSKVARMPLDVLDAETEGQIGYLIQQNLQNLFRKNKNKRSVVTVLTQVLVDKDDPAFDKPSKFVGPFYTKREAKRLKRKYLIKEDVGRGFRRVVPSPRPIEIIEADTIKKLLKQGAKVIAAGGGGIPVVKENGMLRGVEAVVDKDLASSNLASTIGASELIILTDIDKVYLNYKKPGQKGIKRIKAKEMLKLFQKGIFPAGSMGPKIQAGLWFLMRGGKKVIITDVKSFGKKGKGTVIVR
jgi:carbamate kinase